VRIFGREEVAVFGDYAPYLSHNPATFWRYACIESPNVSGGCRRFFYRGIGDLQWNPSLFPYAWKHRKILKTIVVRDPGLALAIDYRTSMRHAVLADHPFKRANSDQE